MPLKRQWYEMIERGEKTEEYREIKPYWEKRLLDYAGIQRDFEMLALFLLGKTVNPLDYPRGYTHVCFSYGYTRRTMTFEVKEITIGKGKHEWGAPTYREVFIIKLGERLS